MSREELMIYAGMGIGIVICIVLGFYIHYRRLWLRIKDYEEFMNLYYMQEGGEIPPMILRVYEENIRDYNRTIDNWLGRFLRFRHYTVNIHNL